MNSSPSDWIPLLEDAEPPHACTYPADAVEHVWAGTIPVRRIGRVVFDGLSDARLLPVGQSIRLHGPYERVDLFKGGDAADRLQRLDNLISSSHEIPFKSPNSAHVLAQLERGEL